MLKKILKRSNSKKQLDFGLPRPKEYDRNYRKGGRSFYFFDFDDNIAFLATPVFIFEKNSSRSIALSTSEYYKIKHLVGERGSVYENFYFDYNDETGSFKHFRDQSFSLWERLRRKPQLFIRDLHKALENVDSTWKAPSWDFFYYATYNQRPMSIITARGHHPETIKTGIRLLVKYKHLPHEPNFLGVYPVSHPPTKAFLGDTDLSIDVPELKRLAIKDSFQQAIKAYGDIPYHRFGMSDDDPANIKLIESAMLELKKEHPEMSFFVIDTTNGMMIKREIKLKKNINKASSETQLSLI